MLTPRWRKVLADLWGNRTRTLLVILSIFTGVFAVGMIGGARAILLRELPAAYLAVNPAHATIYTDPFDEELMHVVERVPGVGQVDARRSITVRMRNEGGEWKSLSLYALPDYEDIRINQMGPEAGDWPPKDRTLLLERTTQSFFGTSIGDVLKIETPNGKMREMRVGGTAHDLNQFPAQFSNQGIGYVTFDTFEWLGVPRTYTELHITVAENELDKEHVEQVAAAVRDKIEKGGRTVYWTWLPEPGEHPIQPFVETFTLILGAIGLLSLLVGGFLVVNTIDAILTQQVRQIGMMKAVGARNGQIVGMYLSLAVAFGVIALVIAVPASTAVGLFFARYAAGLINFDLADLTIPPYVYLVEIAVGLLAPVLAALWPVVRGTRITVREAITDYGIGDVREKKGWIDRWVERIRGLPRPFLLSLRNTFRRKGRLALTMLTLILGGAIFIGVFSVQTSLQVTLDEALQYWQFDAGANFQRSYRAEQVEREALRVPGVVAAESWGYRSTRRLRPNGTESDSIQMIAPPAGTKMLDPVILEGRWLLPEDENAIVVNTDVLADGDPDIGVGDQITLSIDDKESVWQVVGIAKGVMSGPIIYANYAYFSRFVSDVGSASQVQVTTLYHDAEYQARVAKDLEQHFEDLGIGVSSTSTTSELRQSVELQFNMIISYLMIMAVLLAVVGALGLMGTMTINVMERTREIGVMRAIGASNGAIRRIFIGEGVLIGIFSWLIGAVVAVPISKVLSDGIGQAMMNAPLTYAFSADGAVFWLLTMVFLAALASLLPAWRAARLTVRDTLAYE